MNFKVIVFLLMCLSCNFILANERHIQSISNDTITLFAKLPGKIESIMTKNFLFESSDTLYVLDSRHKLIAKRNSIKKEIPILEKEIAEKQEQVSKCYNEYTIKCLCIFDGIPSECQIIDQKERSKYLHYLSFLYQIEEKINDTKYVAPFNGIIIHVYVEVGEIVQPGQPLLEIIKRK